MANKNNNQENKYVGGTFFMKRVLSSTYTYNMLENMLYKEDKQYLPWEEIAILANNFQAFGKNEIKINTVINGTTVFIHLKNIFGHKNTADLIEALHGFTIEENRVTVRLGHHWEVFDAQYRGERLDEGQTVLPEGAELIPMKITIK